MQAIHSLADRFGGVLFVRDRDERLRYANESARRVYPFFEFDGRHATFDALFHATLIRGLNRDPDARSDPAGYLAKLKIRQQAVQRYTYTKTYPGTRYLCMHQRTARGWCAQVRIPVDVLGIGPLLPKEDREIGIEEVLSLRDAMEQARSVVERLSVAIGILSPEGRVVWANGAFRDLVAGGHGLTLDHAGAVIASAASDRDAWTRAVRAAGSRGIETVLALHGGAVPIIAAVESAGNGGVAIRVAARDGHSGIAVVLQELLGVTPAQADVVADLARGFSVADIAGARHTQATTVNNQIKAAMSTGRRNRFAVTRQSTLVRIALDVAAVTGRKATA